MSTYSEQTLPAYSHDGPPVATLDIIVDVDSIGGYEWDRFVVYRDRATGQLYTADGSGCSCNSLEEDWRTLDDLDGPYTLQQIAERAQAWERSYREEWRAERRRGLGARVVEAVMAMERAS